MGGDSAPAPPDYGPIAAASQHASDQANALSQEQFDWAKDAYAKDQATIAPIIQAETQAQQDQNAFAQEQQQRYTSEYQPLEDQLVQDAQSYASPERKDLEMGRAQAGVAQQFDTARQSAQRDLESYGIDPTATRYAALDLGTRSQQAAATAGAGNQASQMVDATGRALRSEAINVGRGYPGQIAGTYNTALGQGTGASNTELAGTASGANTMGTAPQYMGIGNSALGVWGNTLNTGFQNQLGAFNANQQSSSGLGTALGLGLGIGSKFLPAMMAKGGVVKAIPDGKAPRPYDDNKLYVLPAVDEAGHRMTPQEAMARHFATGHHLGAFDSPAHAQAHFANGGAIPSDQTPGGRVPVQASPTGGQAGDDVPAQLTVGEFVVPKDVAAWKGEEYFQKLIESSRKAKSEVTARPDVGPAPAQVPTFASRPQALPVG
jgi:hypothetical protein